MKNMKLLFLFLLLFIYLLNKHLNICHFVVYLYYIKCDIKDKANRNELHFINRCMEENRCNMHNYVSYGWYKLFERNNSLPKIMELHKLYKNKNNFCFFEK